MLAAPVAHPPFMRVFGVAVILWVQAEFGFFSSSVLFDREKHDDLLEELWHEFMAELLTFISLTVEWPVEEEKKKSLAIRMYLPSPLNRRKLRTEDSQ